jgi:RNA polymerase sigma factor (sigma-70 family)
MARVDRAPAGVDRDADLERLYREQGARMWHAVLAVAGDPEVANDAVAEAFAQVLRRGDEVRDPERWIWRAVFKIARGLLRERSRSAPLDVEPSYESSDAARELIAALSRLSVKQREAVVLHYAVGHPIVDVARIIGSTPGAVKIHLLRARQRLRELLEDDDV